MSASFSREEGGRNFSFKTGDLVLVKWNDGMVYFAKIKKIDHKRSKCIVVFDDKSQDDADFDQIHSVDETTTDIICIKCKKDNSDAPNEIVLCDSCGIGFHRRCHIPLIPANAIDLDTPWNCSYCQRGTKCPYLTESLDVLQNLLSDEEEGKEEEEGQDPAATISDEESDDTVYEGSSSSTLRGDGSSKKKKDLAQSKDAKVQSAAAVDTAASNTWRSKTGNKPQQEDDTTKDLDYRSLRSSSTPDSGSELIRKRKKRHPNSQKKHKRASVASRTVSVQRLQGSIHDDSSSNTSTDCIIESDTVELHRPAHKQEKPAHSSSSKKRPRSLRVSLSLPEEVEEGSPFDKVVKAQKLLSPTSQSKETSLPSWEEFSANVPKRTSPLSSSSPSSSSVASQNETSSLVVQPAKKKKLSLPVREEKPPERSEVAFVATPLPSTPPPNRIPLVESSRKEAIKMPKLKSPEDTNPILVQTRSPPSTLVCKEQTEQQPPVVSSPQQPKSAATPVIQSAPKATRVITTPADVIEIPTNSTLLPTNITAVGIHSKGSHVITSPSASYISKKVTPEASSLIPPVSLPVAVSASSEPVILVSPDKAKQPSPEGGRPPSPDLIITAVESPKTAASSAKTPTIQPEPLSKEVATSTVLPESRQATQILEARALAQKKVTAKTVEIQKQIPAGVSQPSSTAAAGSLVLPSPSQTPVTMVSVMVSPSVPAAGTSQYYTTVPTEQVAHTQAPVQYIAAKQPMQKAQVNFPPQPPPYSSHLKQPPAKYVYVVPSTATAAVSDQTAAITTTKPYAIVNALPPSATSQSGMEYIASPTNLQNVGYVQLANTSPLQLQPPNPHDSIRKVATAQASTQSTPSPKTSQQRSFNGISTVQDRHPNISLNSISKKIEGAFATCSEDMLISAFEDAWKKFQANGSKFNSKPQKKVLTAPPNAEVVSISADSRLSLIRPVRSRPKPIAPKANASPISHPSASPLQQRQAAMQYVAQYPLGHSHNARHQDGSYRKQAKTYQSSGLFYPSPASDNSANTTMTSKPPVARTLSQSSVRKVVPKPPASKPLATRVCTLCGEDATYLCSGCRKKWYCGRGCQLKAWDEHSKECKT